MGKMYPLAQTGVEPIAPAPPELVCEPDFFVHRLAVSGVRSRCESEVARCRPNGLAGGVVSDAGKELRIGQRDGRASGIDAQVEDVGGVNLAGRMMRPWVGAAFRPGARMRDGG